MSLSGALNAAISGIGANQRQIQVVSGNVSNANVEGFTKKSLPQSTAVVGLDTNGGVQTGVVQREVNEFLRGRIQNAESELSASETKKEFFQRIQDFFGKVDDNNTLSSAIDQVRKAVEDLSVNPENGAIREQVVAKTQELAGKFRTFTQQTQELRGEADLQIKQSVQSVNENLREIKELNVQISQAEALQKSSAELRDQRDQAVKELSKQIDVNTFTRDTGEVVVVTADENARQLVDGSAAELSFDASGSLGSGESGSQVLYNDGTEVDADSVGGRLGALLQMRDQELPNFQADLDRLAGKLREEVNEAHNLGQVGNAPTAGGATLTGDHAFKTSDVSSSSRPLQLTNITDNLNNDPNVSGTQTLNLNAGGSSFSANVNTSTTSLDALRGNIDSTAGFSATIEGSANNQVLKVTSTSGDPLTASGNLADQLNIQSQSSQEIQSANGTVEIVPVNASGNVDPGKDAVSLDLGQAFTDAPGGSDVDVRDFVGQLNKQVNGSSAVTGNPDPFTLNSDGRLELNNPFGDGTNYVVKQDPDSPATIGSSKIAPTASDSNADNVRDRNFSHFFGLNNFIQTPDRNATDSNGESLPQPVSNPDLVTGDTGDDGTPARTGSGVSAASVIQVNQEIVDSPNELARISPKNKDGEDPLPVGNAKIVREMANAFENKTTFANADAFETTPGASNTANLTNNPSGGNLDGRQATLANFAGDILQDQASRTSNTEQAVKAESGVKEQLELRAENQSGVNIDEELARLSTFQQAFNANARVISVVDELFSTLNQAVR